MFRTLKAMLALLIVMAALGLATLADGALDTKVHYNSKGWLSQSLAQINLGKILAQRNKPWVMAQLPMVLNQFYASGKNEVIPAKVRYIFTVPPLKPLKAVIWLGPNADWGLYGGSISDFHPGRQQYRYELKSEYLCSFQGLVIFRVNEKVKGMHRIDPIWQISEKWQGMVKPAWLFCKKHKRWFLKGGVAQHTADLKKLLVDKNLLLAMTAFHALASDRAFRRKMVTGGLLKYQGVRLGGFTLDLIDHLQPADLPRSKLQVSAVKAALADTASTAQYKIYHNWWSGYAAALARKTSSNEQALWLDAGDLGTVVEHTFQRRFSRLLDQTIQRRLPPSLRAKIPSIFREYYKHKDSHK